MPYRGRISILITRFLLRHTFHFSINFLQCEPMATLYHYPLCPLSRYIRLVFAEMGIEAELIEEKVWERREAFLMLNPACTTPVFVEKHNFAVPGADIIGEYIDETRGLAMSNRRLFPENPGERVEVRRILAWFNQKFYAEVSGLLLEEKVYKRFIPTGLGGGSPDPATIRAARSNVRYHLRYISHLVRQRNWICGEELTYADLAAAAHLSCVDYTGDVPWEDEQPAKEWYARIKSRPSFRPLLADRMMGMSPSAHYDNLDF